MFFLLFFLNDQNLNLLLGDGPRALLFSQAFIVPICAGESLVYHLDLLAAELRGCLISCPLKVYGFLHVVT